MDDIMDAKVGRIAQFLNIEKDDVKFATEPGGDLKLLGHFVAVDHETKSVVLAIRGTHNTSEWVADFDATAGTLFSGIGSRYYQYDCIFLLFRSHASLLFFSISPILWRCGSQGHGGTSYSSMGES
jgi:hypothetical protein